MRNLAPLFLALGFAASGDAAELNLSTATSSVAGSNAIRLNNLSYGGALYSVTLYLNLDGSWSLGPTSSNGSLDFTSGKSWIFSPDSVLLTGITYGGAQYNATLRLNLDGTWTLVDVGAANTGGFSLGSPAVKSDHILPFSYTCDGLNAKGERGGLSPALSFSNVPAGTQSFAVTMHIVKGQAPRTSTESLWVLYDIPATTTSFAAGETGGGTLGVSEQGQNAYFPPCSHEPILNSYTITAYALPKTLGLAPGAATYDAVTAAAKAAALASTTLVLSNLRYNPMDTTDLQVPTKVPSTCEEKAVAFAPYSTDGGSGKVSIKCDGTTMYVTSIDGLPYRSSLDVDKPTVGTEAWIGRVPLTRTTTWNFPVVPSYIATPTSNVSVHDPIGISVDGIPILHYAKESYNGEIAQLGTDYSARDTVLLGELDQCGAHAGNGEDYHYHYAPLCLMDSHNPSQPLAYMFDGIPLYFGTAGGTVTGMGGITKVNYGGGRYDDLDFRPTAVKTGAASLDECNAYDINGDGPVSGYVYYTTKTPPYTIGCYRGVANQVASAPAPAHWNTDRDISWSGADVLLTDYGKMEFQGHTWSYIDMQPETGNNKLAPGTTGVILYRPAEKTDPSYQANADCWIFRYRLNKTDTAGTNDSVETPCR